MSWGWVVRVLKMKLYKTVVVHHVDWVVMIHCQVKENCLKWST